MKILFIKVKVSSYGEIDNIYIKFSVSTILGLIGSILGIIAIFTYFQPFFSLGLRYFDFEAILGILLIVLVIVASFYVNKNGKNGSILLIVVGILIFFYSAGVLPQVQLVEGGYIYSDFTYFINPWDLLYVASIIIFVSGIYGIIKNSGMLED